MTTALLETRRLNVSIAGIVVCTDMNVTIRAGECWGLMGVNGVGKSTLLKTLCGLHTDYQGDLLVGDESIHGLSNKQRAKKIGMLFQSISDPFPNTVFDTALIGRHPHHSNWHWETQTDLDITRDALKMLGLESLTHRKVTTLSGGERRRLAIATLITQAPDLYLLDEPTNHLDLHYTIKVLNLFTDRIASTGKAALMILHDPNLVSRYCDRLIMLFGNGEYQCGRTQDILSGESLTKLFGHPIQSLPAPQGNIYLPE